MFLMCIYAILEVNEFSLNNDTYRRFFINNSVSRTHSDSTVLLSEDFETGFPANWSVSDGNGDGVTWTTGTTADLFGYSPPGYNTQYAYYSDDDAGSSSPPSFPGEDLKTPSIYILPYDTIIIIFGYGFAPTYDGDDTFEVNIRTFSQGSWSDWINYGTFPHMSSSSDTIKDSFNADSLQVMWRYYDYGGWNYAASIDNVNIIGVSSFFSHDVGVYSFPSPPQYYKLNQTYDVIATYKNYGLNLETLAVYIELYDEMSNLIFSDSMSGITLNPGDTLRKFWGSVNTEGYKRLFKKTWTYLSKDENTENDTIVEYIYEDINGNVFNSSTVPSPPSYAIKGKPYPVVEYYSNEGNVGDTFLLHLEIFLNGELLLSSDTTRYFPPFDSIEVLWDSIAFPDTGHYTIVTYISNPYDVRNANDTLVINGVVGGWEYRGRMPQCLMDHAVIYKDGKVYIIGGYNGTTSLNTLYIFDVQLDTFYQGAPLDSDIARGDAAVIGDTIYFPGGYSYSHSIILDSLYKYSISGNNWVISSGTGEPAIHYRCVSVNGKLYKIGGYDIETGIQWASTWVYDPSTGEWIKKSDMPYPLDQFGICANGNFIYVIGGLDRGTNYVYKKTLFYDFLKDVWFEDSTKFSYFPIQIDDNPCVIFKDTIWSIGGFNPDELITNRVYYYDMSNNKWVHAYDYPICVRRMDAVAVDSLNCGDNGIYVFGGDEVIGNWSPTDSIFARTYFTTGFKRDTKVEPSISFFCRFGSKIRFKVNGKTVSIRVYDLTGKKIYEYKNISPNRIVVFPSSYPSGTYFLKIEGIDKIEKFIVIK